MTITIEDRAIDFLRNVGYTEAEINLLILQDKVLEEANEQYGSYEADREKELITCY